ncbi:stabilin-2 isoform X2 [Dunckerocampus dactyliophorus]|uniref:stabilin-2 isoform X2 n=1 Tax=Dunckerocampus dactyliophorus TaxID=161453 RepID=UPI002404E003|nr:stabilin-2 isoform X2 [Dunckerocampus dactyliophorus]
MKAPQTWTTMMMMMMMMMMMTMMNEATSLTSQQNWCSNSTVLRTRTSCHSCSLTAILPCPSGYKKTPGSTVQDCQVCVCVCVCVRVCACVCVCVPVRRYYIRSATLKLSITGCSFECYKEAELKRCCPGYWGPDCTECPVEAERPCNDRGSCFDGLGGNGTCSCQAGFAGSACEDCEAGRYGLSCREVCSCVHGLCDAGLKGNGACTCFSGYTGPKCDQELPACASLQCPSESRCMEEALTGRLVCRCMLGYRQSGDECLSVNPCAQQVCHMHATCVHSGPNRHLCACNQGYSGDGRVCMAVDPCQTKQGGCSAASTRCVYDGPGKSHCECLPGFDKSADGSCRLADSCTPTSCHKNANCTTVEPGRVQCTCLQGYHGDGNVCYGNIIQRLNELNTEPGGPWSGQLTSAITLFGSVSWPLQNLGPFTLFVPINKGFRGMSLRTLTADPSKAKYLCKMHLVAGVMTFDMLKKSDVFYTLTGKSAESDTSEGDSQTKIRIHGNRKRGVVIQSDLVASNGMIHIINKLMDSVAATVESNVQENLIKILSDYGKFGTFTSLLESVDLASILDVPGPLTVFAPVSSAFGAMAESHLEYLRSDAGATKRVELLRNHIVPSTQLDVFTAVSGPQLFTMANQVLSIKVSHNGQVMVNTAAVLEAAVEAKNGRLYVVDALLMPASIEPLLPHRCDVTENRIVKGKCTSCSKVKLSQCSSGGVYTGSSVFGCLYSLSIGGTALGVPVTGCSPLCNVTVTTPACCDGFYGPDCKPCPGGHQTPCSGRSQCFDGIEGNGTCNCPSNLKGSRCQLCASSNKFGPECDTACPCIHGLCDNRPDSDGRCKPDSCQPGFTGRFCERRTAPCGTLAQFCHAHADCDFRWGAPSCICRPGYQGDGITCVESDPCAPPFRGGCSLNARCVKTGLSTRACQCLTGWQEDGDECQPINNCLADDRGSCHPNATCVYVGPGQSDCTCNSGYRGNGRKCVAVNGCVSQSGDCHFLASCKLRSSEWTCVCDDGYAGNGRLCYGSIQQELAMLPEASDFSTWIAEAGLSLSFSDQNVTLLLPSSAAVAKMSPVDKKFWVEKGNLPSLIRHHMIDGVHPLNSLSTTSSLTSLLNTPLPVSTSQGVTCVGGAAISTADLAATNGIIHVVNAVVLPDRKLSEGLLATLQRRRGLSLFTSYLMEYELMDEIERAGEFTVFAPTDAAVKEYLDKMAATALDVNTTRYHLVASERLLKTDLQSGGYKETLLGFRFQLGFFPRDGKLFVNDAPINTSNVLSGNNGVVHVLSAVLNVKRNRCDEIRQHKVKGSCVDCLFPRGDVCPAGSSLDVRPGCLALGLGLGSFHVCKHAVLQERSKRVKCMFTRSFEGERLLTIGCRATCLQTQIVHVCCHGFYGPHCESCPGVKGQPCFGNGICLDGTNGTGLCRCNEGFVGMACETCQAGKYGVHCDQVCRCQNGRCNEGPRGDGTCECDVGWRGVVCDEKIQSSPDAELCGSVLCHTSANCVVRPSGSECLCAAGFRGNGTFCQAKDACVQDNGGCSLFAVCKRTRPGQRVCVCDQGFSGDGLVCVEINPCLEGNGGCHANADCVHVGPNKASCRCLDGYTGDGRSCTVVNLCQKKNGGCHRYARCNMTGPGVRTCTCAANFIGDGLTCKGTLSKEILSRHLLDFYLGLMFVEISLKGRGPFTVFAPSTSAYLAEKNGPGRMKRLMSDKHKEDLGTVMRSHMVMCHMLLPADLRPPQNLTTLSGLVLTTSSSAQGSIFINEANVTYSDDVSVNGIFHEIDRILFPPGLDAQMESDAALNLTPLADRHGYRTFYKLLQDTGVMDMVHDGMYQPVTLFLPSDVAMATLPQEQKDFLLHPHNREQLKEYLKYHVLQNHKGSSLSFSCGGTDQIGQIFVNDGQCRIVQRHLAFNGGIAYGIDCLLTPPNLGGRCDEQTSFDLQMTCGLCASSANHCPGGSKLKAVEKCDLPAVFVSRNSGCRSVCTFNLWQPKCCHGYYGRDCQACPGGVGAVCSHRGNCDDGHLGNGTCTCTTGFGGVACELCADGFYGANCEACNCLEHGTCDDGRRGTGSCFCEAGWTGERCETWQAEVVQCSPSCSVKAVCRDNNTCVCQPFYEGDGYTCTAADMCDVWNGGCAKVAKCSQYGEQVTCTCPKGHSGDGFICQPIDPCVAGDNGGCHKHATCIMTSPAKRKCACKDGFIGDGITCEVQELPISRCLQDNGQCHQDAQCTDLHFEDVTVGVFHVRSEDGQYKLNFTAARSACAATGGVLASYTQLSYAQQGGLNMCAAGWLDGAQVAYPTTYANPNCGFGHVGIVDYGIRKNVSETWDAFCFRMKDVNCECKSGYVGDGFSCTGNLLQVLMSTPALSNFLTQVLNVSQMSEAGRQYIKRLQDPAVQSTLFVPDNDGLMDNKTLSQRDLEFHLSEGQALTLIQLTNGTRLRTRVGTLSVVGLTDILDPSALSSRYVNDRFVAAADIMAANGVIHILQGPLLAPPPRQEIGASHKAGVGLGAVLLVILVSGFLFVGFHFYRRSDKLFQFHYFKENEDEEEAVCAARSITNPVYEDAPPAQLPDTVVQGSTGSRQVEDLPQVS